MKRIVLNISLFFVLIFIKINILLAQNTETDTIKSEKSYFQNQEHFYDSLKSRANQRKITKLFYDFLISPPEINVDKKSLALNYYNLFNGKIISEIKIKSFDVFGPTFQDTAKTTSRKLELIANKIHTKSNLSSIQKLLLFKVGDNLEPEIILENERLIRLLPYIKEVNIILEQHPLNSGLVKVLILIRDRFSFGASGNVNGIQSAAFELYNNNIFGIGHEINVVFAGHVNKQPYLGSETYYNIKNLQGKFIDITLGYLNTYKSEGFRFNLNKPFITSSIKWGYGITALRMFRADWIFQDDAVLSEIPMDFAYYGAWGGRSFQLGKNKPQNAQIVISSGINKQNFLTRPDYKPGVNNYFANRTFLLGSATFTQRRFIQDDLVYSYGITEDIPEGFKNEIVYGYDISEFGNRHYAHILLSNGNFLTNRKGYLYIEGDFGSYFGSHGFQQGQVDARLYFISKKIYSGQKTYRLFVKTDYTLGMHRFEVENLNLNRKNSIRGFANTQITGKQRLSLNLEYVLFLKQQFYNFNMAVFGFSDIGVIGSNKEFILKQDYYSGIGFGIRLHNENLVFKTLQMRLAFYPFRPQNMNFTGFVIEEQSKRQFYSFEPAQPMPLKFE